MRIKLIASGGALGSRLAVAPRRNTDNALEAAGEVTLAAKADIVGNLRGRQTLHQQLLGLLDTQAFEVRVRRHASGAAEHPHEVERAQAGLSRQGRQRDSLGVMGLQEG